MENNLLRTISGSPFEGHLLGDQLYLACANRGHSFVGTAYEVPADIVFHRISGFRPFASLGVAFQNLPGGNLRVTLTSGGTFSADARGVLVFIATSYGPLDVEQNSQEHFLSAFFGTGEEGRSGRTEFASATQRPRQRSWTSSDGFAPSPRVTAPPFGRWSFGV